MAELFWLVKYDQIYPDGSDFKLSNTDIFSVWHSRFSRIFSCLLGGVSISCCQARGPLEDLVEGTKQPNDDWENRLGLLNKWTLDGIGPKLIKNTLDTLNEWHCFWASSHAPGTTLVAKYPFLVTLLPAIWMLPYFLAWILICGHQKLLLMVKLCFFMVEFREFVCEKKGNPYSGWWFGTFIFPIFVGMMIQSDELIFLGAVGIPPTSICVAFLAPKSPKAWSSIYGDMDPINIPQSC